MPKRFESPVELPTAVFYGLETVQETRETSMLDHRAVQEIAARLGYPRPRCGFGSTSTSTWRASLAGSWSPSSLRWRVLYRFGFGR